VTDPSFLATEVSKRAQRALSSIDRTAENQHLHSLELRAFYDERMRRLREQEPTSD
jgi:hypothetical protein